MRRILSPKALVISGVLALLALALACGPAATPTPTPAPTSTPTTAPIATATPTTAQQTTPTPTATKAPPAGITPTGTLRVALDTVGDSPDPRKSNRGRLGQFTTEMFDSLLDVDPVTGALAPGVATSWDQSADGLTWTFHLRKDLKFWDGHPVTSEDVLWSFKWQTSPYAQAINQATYRKNLSNVTATDDYTVVTKLPQPNVTWPWDVSSTVESVGAISPKHYADANNLDPQVQNTALDEKVLGSGPWKFVAFKRHERFDYEAWTQPHPYRPTPAFAKLTLYEIPEGATRMAMARTGEVDVFAIAPDAVPELERSGLAKSFVPETNAAVILFTNLWDPRITPNHPLQDIRVRKAIALSVDRDKIISTVMGGLATFPIGSAAWAATAGLDYQEELTRMRQLLPYDPEQAKKLLADAGYPGGKGMPKLNWNAYTTTDTPWLSDITLAMAEMIGQNLGIEFDTFIGDSAVFDDLWLDTGVDAPRTVGALATRRTACRPIGLPRWKQQWDLGDAESMMGAVDENGKVLWTSPMYEQYQTLLKKTDTVSMDEYLKALKELKHWMDETYMWPPTLAGGGLWGYNPKVLQTWQGTPCRIEIGINFEHMKPLAK